jgi:DNA-directed RNA polymerase subunit beta'
VGDTLFSWDPYSEPIVADFGGTIRFIDIVEEETVREELDESTGRRQMVITEDRSKKLHPMIEIQDEERREAARVHRPGGRAAHGARRRADQPGSTLAKIAREAYKTRDITGGLPRIAELFEARKPKDPAVITEIDGTVRFGDIKRGKREVIVIPETGNERVYEVPVGKHLRVHEADNVRAGDRLSEGPINPHDILRIKGPRAVQEYLLNEVQEVYRLQGVKINDKHIGVIVRQMLQKVRIVEPGTSEFLEGRRWTGRSSWT